MSSAPKRSKKQDILDVVGDLIDRLDIAEHERSWLREENAGKDSEIYALEARNADLQRAVDDALAVFVDTKWHEAYQHLASGDDGDWILDEMAAGRDPLREWSRRYAALILRKVYGK